MSETTTVDANVGFSIDGLSIGGGATDENTKSTTMSKQVSFSIPPKRQAVFVAGQNNKAQNGRVRVNFADRQFGHFIVRTIGDSTRVGEPSLIRVCILVVHQQQRDAPHAHRRRRRVRCARIRLRYVPSLHIVCKAAVTDRYTRAGTDATDLSSLNK